MMKKLFSMMLAVLMLALPVLANAEAADIAAAGEALEQISPSARYMAEGQEMTVDVTLAPSEIVLSQAQLPEEYAGAIGDLFALLGIRVTAQTTENQAQSGLALLVDGEEAVNGKVAFGEKGLYAASTLLGDKILLITPDQLKDLGNKLLDQLVASGKISQEALDSLKSFIAQMQEDPSGTIMGLIGEPDPTALMNAVYGLAAGISMGEVTEAPEAFPEAASVITVQLQKEALTNVTTELAKFLWSMPGVQKIAKISPKGPKSEDGLIEVLNRIPGKLAEDGTLTIYADETGTRIYAVADLKVNAEGGAKDVDCTALLAMEGELVTMDMNIASGDAKVNVHEEVKASENGAEVNMHVTSEDVADGTAYQPIEEIVAVNFVAGETQIDFTMDMTARVQQDPSSDPVGVTMKVTATEADAGDHAEGSASYVVGMEGMGDLFTLNAAMKTDVAEAYIISDDAVEVMSMTEEEQQELMSGVQANAMMALFSVLPKLPESVQQLITGQ